MCSRRPDFPLLAWLSLLFMFSVPAFLSGAPRLRTLPPFPLPALRCPATAAPDVTAAAAFVSQATALPAAFVLPPFLNASADVTWWSFPRTLTAFPGMAATTGLLLVVLVVVRWVVFFGVAVRRLVGVLRVACATLLASCTCVLLKQLATRKGEASHLYSCWPVTPLQGGSSAKTLSQYRLFSVSNCKPSLPLYETLFRKTLSFLRRRSSVFKKRKFGDMSPVSPDRKYYSFCAR